MTCHRFLIPNSYAYSGGGRGILSVLVSVDGGHTWHEADLEPVSPPNVVDPSNLIEGDLALEHRNSRQWAWTLWRVSIPIPGNDLVDFSPQYYNYD